LAFGFFFFEKLYLAATLAVSSVLWVC